VAGAEPLGGNISRRSVLTRALVAGGVVWAAPVISSVPAYAGEKDPKKGTTVPCTKYFAARFTLKGIASIDAGDVCPELAAFIREHPDIPFEFPADRQPELLASQPSLEWKVLLPDGLIPDPGYSARLIMGFGSAGGECCPAYTGASDREVFFPQCAKAPLDTVQLIYCSP
jgi:hypothetical protein